MTQYAFGSGTLIGKRTDVTGTPPCLAAAVQAINRVLTRVVSSIGRVAVTDAQSGFRVFTRAVAALPIRATFTYTQAQIIRTARANMSVREVPITFKKRLFGSSRLISSKPYAGLRMLSDIFSESYLANLERG
jgi:hypothetical protein